MKNRFTSFRDETELLQLFQNHLVIGKATLEDTQEFLDRQGLHCSEAIKKDSKYFNTLIKTFDKQSSVRFDGCIGCKIPISPNKIITWNLSALFQFLLHSFFVKWYCLVHFYFYEGILTEITIKRTGIGL